MKRGGTETISAPPQRAPLVDLLGTPHAVHWAQRAEEGRAANVTAVRVQFLDENREDLTGRLRSLELDHRVRPAVHRGHRFAGRLGTRRAIARGDLLATPATGAYGRVMASNYNSVLWPAGAGVRDGVARVLIRRDTIEDLLSWDVAPGA